MKNKAKKACLPAGRVGLFDPYLDTLGGGEKHILSILEVFSEQGFTAEIFWDKNLSKKISERFSLTNLKKIKFLPSPFRNGTSSLKNFITLRGYDYFFYVTDGSYFFSSAKNNFIFAMVPNVHLYNRNIVNKLKLSNFRFISNSQFTKKWLNQWGIKSIIIPPYIDNRLMSKNKSKKEKIILSVGRFFSQLHSKNQDTIIKAFMKLKNQSKEFIQYKLILAGGLMKEDQKYFDALKKLVGNDTSVDLKTNIPLEELYDLYQRSEYFWHFTGYGVDENKNPEKVEHLGISPLEAMASGCLTFCYNAGGPKELIKDGQNGFLFNNLEDIVQKMTMVNPDNLQKEKITNEGRQFVKKNFSYEVFKNEVLKLL